MLQVTDRRPTQSGRPVISRRLAELIDLPVDRKNHLVAALRSACDIADASVAAISVTDGDGTWFSASVGAGLPRSVQRNFCARVVREGQPLVVLSARTDERFFHPACGEATDFTDSYVGYPFRTDASGQEAELSGVFAVLRVASPPAAAALQRLDELATEVGVALSGQPRWTETVETPLADVIPINARSVVSVENPLHSALENA